MQKSLLKLTNISISVLMMSLILVILRTALLIFGFDFESSFFRSDSLAYLLYALTIGACIISFVMSRSVSLTSTHLSKKPLTDILISTVAVIFVCFAVIYFTKALDYFKLAPHERNPLKTVSFVLCLPTSVLSVVYYLIRLFTNKEKSSLISIFAISPVVFLSALLLDRFATVSASAASLSHFPEIIALLILAFFMLVEGKTFIRADIQTPILPCSFITFTTLTFSAVPDLITLIIGRNSLSFEGIIFLVLKLIFAIYVFTTTNLMAHNIKEINE